MLRHAGSFIVQLRVDLLDHFASVPRALLPLPSPSYARCVPVLSIDLDASFVREEPGWVDGRFEEVVVVHPDESGGEPRDSEEESFDDITIECRLVLYRDERILIYVLESAESTR